MEPTQIYRHGSKDNMHDSKISKQQNSTSVPSNDKKDRNVKFSEKTLKDFDQPAYMGEDPSTPNGVNKVIVNEEINLLSQMHQGRMQSQDSSHMENKGDNMVTAQSKANNSAQRHLSNKSDTNLSQNQSHIGPGAMNANPNLVKFEKVRKEKSET